MKKTIIIALFSLVSIFTVKAQHSITVTITNLENSNGQVLVELEDENHKVVKQIAASISNEEATFTFENIETGTYAISYFHDENDNGKMDTGTFGIPKEGYGFSNDARGFMGPPDFEDMLFELKADVEMKLKTVN